MALGASVNRLRSTGRSSTHKLISMWLSATCRQVQDMGPHCQRTTGPVEVRSNPAIGAEDLAQGPERFQTVRKRTLCLSRELLAKVVREVVSVPGGIGGSAFAVPDLSREHP